VNGEGSWMIGSEFAGSLLSCTYGGWWHLVVVDGPFGCGEGRLLRLLVVA